MPKKAPSRAQMESFEKDVQMRGETIKRLYVSGLLPVLQEAVAKEIMAIPKYGFKAREKLAKKIRLKPHSLRSAEARILDRLKEWHQKNDSSSSCSLPS